MGTQFDPIKALREEITGLSEIQGALATRRRSAEGALGQAEIELNALRKLEGFAALELERKLKVLHQLEEEQQQ